MSLCRFQRVFDGAEGVGNREPGASNARRQRARDVALESRRTLGRALRCTPELAAAVGMLQSEHPFVLAGTFAGVIIFNHEPIPTCLL